VGVGQSELDVARMADTTLLVLVPEAGDGIQALKSGVMEAADVYAINKADRPGADKLRQEIEVTLGIRRGNAYRNVPVHHGALKSAAARRMAEEDGRWMPPVLLTIAAKGEGVTELVEALDRHHAWLDAGGELAARRRSRMRERARDVVDRALRRWAWEESRAAAVIDERLDEVAGGRLSPYELAGAIVGGLKQETRV
jgi:LAO/AO transport system kinase